jgi:hypothetical protein
MKTEKCYAISILAVVSVILTIGVQAKIHGLWPEEQRTLLAEPYPNLAGIQQLFVVIVLHDAEPNRQAVFFQELQAGIEQKLQQAGIEIARQTPGGDVPTSLDIPELRVYADIFRFDSSQRCVFRVQTTLARRVHLFKDPKSAPHGESTVALKADVWKTKPFMGMTVAGQMHAEIEKPVMNQVEAFLCAYQIARSQEQADDARSTTTAASTSSKQSSQQPTNQVTAKYQYVASKNSNVFHKPDCRWAQKISPTNLVGYNSRDEAIRAGKRPCKWCNP